MNIPRAFVFTVLVGILLMGSLLAADPPFSVTIVPYRQEKLTAEGRPNDDGTPFPIIRIPMKDDPVHADDGKLTGYHFYVVIRNVSGGLLTLDYLYSDWYDCLTFQIMAANGKTFTVTPDAKAFYANALESWTAKPGDMRVLKVDFTTRGWTGFPSQTDLPRNETFQINAIFKYYNKPQKKEPVECESPLLEAHSR